MASAPHASRRNAGAVLPQPHPPPAERALLLARPRRSRASRARPRAPQRASAALRSRSARRDLRVALLIRVPSQFSSSCAPASPDFSGWNWVALTSPSSTAATNRSPCSAVVTSPDVCVRGVGVHEVEAGVARQAGERCSSRRGTSTVFQPMCGSTGACSGSTRPGSTPSPPVSTPCSTPASNSTCMPTQMPSTGRSARNRAATICRARRSRAARPCTRRTRRRPGTTRPSAFDRCRAVGGHRHVGTDPLERALGRAEIARPVVEDDDALHPRLQHALGRRHALHARVELDRGAQRPGHRLVLRLGDVVPVAAGVHGDVQRDRGVVDEGFEDVPGERGGVVGADGRRRAVRLVCAPGTGRPDRSTAACTSASSIGISASPKRRVPALSPAACANAWPSAMAVSSTVWCASMCRSPSTCTVRSNRPCLPNEVSMWS